jgi:hypothetical protein
MISCICTTWQCLLTLDDSDTCDGGQVGARGSTRDPRRDSAFRRLAVRSAFGLSVFPRIRRDADDHGADHRQFRNHLTQNIICVRPYMQASTWPPPACARCASGMFTRISRVSSPRPPAGIAEGLPPFRILQHRRRPTSGTCRPAYRGAVRANRWLQ